MKTLSLVALLAVLVVTPSRADHCAQSVVQKVVTTQAVVAHHAAPVAAVVVPTVQTIAVQPVLLPIYSAVYQPLEQRNHNEELLSELKSLRLKVESLEQTRQPVRQQLRDEPALKTSDLLGTKCAACHSPGSAEAKGGGLTMFDSLGKLSLTEEQKLDAIGQVASGKMPKGTKLSGENKRQAIDLLK